MKNAGSHRVHDSANTTDAAYVMHRSGWPGMAIQLVIG